ncbi:hypothetical protein FACS1894184_06080 [Clostridia bacterium]|nr:hypothetical protein FACS1894184_06080 [Clostridia bacterium]
MLHNKNLNMPFCLCWANENWSRRWDGRDKDILIEQHYSYDPDQIELHFRYLLEYFLDKRYLHDSESNPLFLIYRVENIPNMDTFINMFNKLARDNDIERINFISQYPVSRSSRNYKQFDYIGFEPLYTRWQLNNDLLYAFIENPYYVVKSIIKAAIRRLSHNNLAIYSYSEVSKASINRKGRNAHTMLSSFPGWDNTPRRNKNGTVYTDSTPELFGEYTYNQFVNAHNEANDEFFFVNAWNEWGEGAHLEPDSKWGYRYLEAIEAAKIRFTEKFKFQGGMKSHVK